MSTAVVNVKIDSVLKKQAQKVAGGLGFSLGGVIKAYLRQLVRTKRVNFDLNEQPSDYLLNSLKKSQEDIKKGKIVSFKNSLDAVNYLDTIISNEPKRKKS